MRDFGPEQMTKRNYIFQNIKDVFQKYGFMPLETPAMENLSVLTGKYGDEGDRLLYKVLNSGDFLGKVTSDDFTSGSKEVLPKVSEKGLKYDLTVPFARYVVKNRHELTIPFKRYQMQPVWRADNPQKGRYREFYQCDADVIGTESLLCETEIILMINEVFEQLGITDFTIKMNHRKILNGVTEYIGAKDKETDFLVAIDKLDKIGMAKVKQELVNRGLTNESVEKAEQVLNISGENLERLNILKNVLEGFPSGEEGINDIESILAMVQKFGLDDHHIELDVTLARGLSYYTGTIFEVKVNNVSMGSVTGGGRYDDLTGVFGVPDLSGVGFSFGVDRIYDVMEELDLFPSDKLTGTKVLIIHLDQTSFEYGLGALNRLRRKSISSEIFPDPAKPKKQFSYANKKGIPYVIVVGSEEVNTGLLTFKDMHTGNEEKCTLESIIGKLSID